MVALLQKPRDEPEAEVNAKRFYELYWKSDSAPPREDPTTGDRMRQLRTALRSLFGNWQLASIHLLDAGCGDGEFLAFLRGLGLEVSGVDVSETAIERAKRRCPEADLRVGSLEDRLPFADKTFDAIWCTEVLEHVFDVHRALAELNRVLKVGGALLLTTPYHGLIKNLLIAALGFDRHFNPELSHIRFFTQTSLNHSLRRAGFVSVAWSGVGRVWPVWKTFFVAARKERLPEAAPAIIG
jgi:SAM-dependent methyltransferase